MKYLLPIALLLILYAAACCAFQAEVRCARPVLSGWTWRCS